MRHVNTNLIAPVLAGIAAGEAAGAPVDWPALRAELDRLAAELRPVGDRPFVVSSYLKAKALAHAQGYIAAARDDSHRLARLEKLAEAVRAGLCGLPDHPWIPGYSAAPVRDALAELDE